MWLTNLYATSSSTPFGGSQLPGSSHCSNPLYPWPGSVLLFNICICIAKISPPSHSNLPNYSVLVPFLQGPLSLLMWSWIHSFTIHSKSSDEPLLLSRPSARCWLVITPFSKTWTFWKIHIEVIWRIIYLSVSLLAVLDWKTSYNCSSPTGFLPLLSLSPNSKAIHSSQVAVCQHSGSLPSARDPLPHPHRTWQGNTRPWEFLHKIEESLHLLKPNQQTLREPCAPGYRLLL